MKFSQIEVSNIRFGKLEDNIRTPSQKIAFIYYQDDRTRLNAITPEFINGDLRHFMRGTLLPDGSVESFF